MATLVPFKSLKQTDANDSDHLTRVYLNGPGVNEVLAVDQVFFEASDHHADTTWQFSDHLGTARTTGRKVSVDDWELLHRNTDPAGVDAHFAGESTNLLGDTADAALLAAPILFAGHQFDTGINLYDMRARWYDPRTQHLLSEDPLGLAGGSQNLYAYAGFDPLNNIDPDGRQSFELSAGVEYTDAQRDQLDRHRLRYESAERQLNELEQRPRSRSVQNQISARRQIMNSAVEDFTQDLRALNRSKWLGTLSEPEKRRVSRGGLKMPVQYRVPLTERELSRTQLASSVGEIALITAASLAHPALGTTVALAFSANRIAEDPTDPVNYAFAALDVAIPAASKLRGLRAVGGGASARNIGGGRFTFDEAAQQFRNGRGDLVPFSEVQSKVGASLERSARRLGLGEGDTLARLDVGGRSLLGRNSGAVPGGTNVGLRPLNPITRTHAEAEVFQRFANKGFGGETGVLFVNRGFCASCGRNGGVGSLLRATGLQRVVAVTPDGTFIINATKPSAPIPITIR